MLEIKLHRVALITPHNKNQSGPLFEKIKLDWLVQKFYFKGEFIYLTEKCHVEHSKAKTSLVPASAGL
jgi:hypothetical protein